MQLSLTNALQIFKLKINSMKTKILIIGNNEMRSNIDIKIGNTKLEQVKQFWYLENTITKDNFCMIEINRRITLGK